MFPGRWAFVEQSLDAMQSSFMVPILKGSEEAIPFHWGLVRADRLEFAPKEPPFPCLAELDLVFVGGGDRFAAGCGGILNDRIPASATPGHVCELVHECACELEVEVATILRREFVPCRLEDDISQH
jgi:hypothetical protein